MTARDDISRDNASASNSDDGEPEAAGVDGKKETDDSASYLKRLLAEGHGRTKGDTCMICFLPIELPVEHHSIRRGCATAVFMLRSREGWGIDAPFVGRPTHTTTHPLLQWSRGASTRATQKQ